MIEIIAGTNRPQSNSLRVAQLLHVAYQERGIPAGLLNLQELPVALLDPSAYGSKPPGWAPFQERVLGAGGLHFVVPEYNGSFPGVLKLFLDMLRHPDSLQSRPVAFTGLASGQWGGVRPVEQLQMVVGYRNAFTYPERVFIPAVDGRFDDQGTFTDAELLARLQAQAAGFAQFVERLSAP